MFGIPSKSTGSSRGLAFVVGCLLTAAAVAQINPAKFQTLSDIVFETKGKVLALEARITELEKLLSSAQSGLDRTQNQVTELRKKMLVGAGAGGEGAPGRAASRVTAPFIVVDENGRQVFVVSEINGEVAATITAANGNTAALLASADQAATVTLSRSGSRKLATLVASTDGKSLGVRTQVANDVRISLGTFRNQPDLTGLRINNERGKMATQIGLLGSDVSVFSLQRGEDKGPSIDMSTEGSAAEIHLGNQLGNVVAGLHGNDAGGSVILTGPGGGNTAAKLGVNNLGGFLSVFPRSGGNARAEVRGSGEIAVFAATGKVVGTLYADRKDAGYLNVGDSSGSVLAEMGVTRDQGVGFVKLGPGGGGIAQSMNGIGRPASALIGKRVTQ